MATEQPRAAGTQVKTHPVRVKVYARNGAVIEGLAHIKPGAYQRRISDVLNLGQMKYIAVTEARYQMPGTDVTESDCVLVQADDIVMMDAQPPRDGDADKVEPLLPGASM